MQFYKNDFIKIPSGEINNFLLKVCGNLKKKVILSSGMSTIDEITLAINTIIKSGTPKKKYIFIAP